MFVACKEKLLCGFRYAANGSRFCSSYLGAILNYDVSGCIGFNLSASRLVQPGVFLHLDVNQSLLDGDGARDAFRDYKQPAVPSVLLLPF